MPVLTPSIPLVTLQQYLAAAQAAYHNLQIGAQVASLSYEGKSVTYSKADLFALAAYIRDLQAAIDVWLGIVEPRQAPVQFVF